MEKTRLYPDNILYLVSNTLTYRAVPTAGLKVRLETVGAESTIARRPEAPEQRVLADCTVVMLFLLFLFVWCFGVSFRLYFVSRARIIRTVGSSTVRVVDHDRVCLCRPNGSTSARRASAQR